MQRYCKLSLDYLYNCIFYLEHWTCELLLSFKLRLVVSETGAFKTGGEGDYSLIGQM